MKTLKSIFTALMLSMFIQNVSAKAPELSGACANNLKKAYDVENDFLTKTLSDNKGWFLNYSIISNVWDPVQKVYRDITNNGELMGAKHIRYMKTDDTELYMDEKEVYTVINNTKTVMRTRSSKEAFNKTSSSFFDLFSDSLSKVYEIESCETSADITKYNVRARKNAATKFSKLIFYVDNKTNTFKKMYVELNPLYNRELKYYTFIVKQRGEKMLDKSWFPVSQKILLPGGRLKAPYASYTYKNLIKN